MSGNVSEFEKRVDQAVDAASEIFSPNFADDTVDLWKAGPKHNPQQISQFTENIGNSLKVESAKTVVRAKALNVVLSDNKIKFPLNVIYKNIADVGKITPIQTISRPSRADGFVRVGGVEVPITGRTCLKLENSLYLEGKLINLTFALTGADSYINKAKAVEGSENLINMPGIAFTNFLVSKGAPLVDLQNTPTVGFTSGDSTSEVSLSVFQNIASTLHSLMYFYTAGQLAALENVDDDCLPAQFLYELFPGDSLDINVLLNYLKGKGALKNTVQVSKMNDALKYFLHGAPYCIPYQHSVSYFMNPTGDPPYGVAPSLYIYAPMSMMVAEALATNNGLRIYCDSITGFAYVTNTELRNFVSNPAYRTPEANAAVYRAKLEDQGTNFVVEGLYRNEINYTILKDSYEYSLIEPLL